MLIFALSFLLGNLGLHCLPRLPAAPWAWGAGLGLLAMLVVMVFSTQVQSVLRTTAIMAIGLLCGLMWAWFAARHPLQQALERRLEGQNITVTGTIVELPELENYGQRFVFAVESADQPVPARLKLTWYASSTTVAAAQRWQFTVRLKRPHGFANPGGRDYELQLLRHGIGATGYVYAGAPPQYMGMATGLPVLKLRAALASRIAAALSNASMQGVIRGLAIGDQQAISSDIWQVFARTGISHLMAISGFHIGMVAWLFAWIGRLLLFLPFTQRVHLTAPRVEAVFGMSAALGYSLLAGMSVPTQRTLIMLAVYFIARCLQRAMNVWHGYALALLLVLLVDPFASLSPGAWLSFGAVAIILLNQQGRLGKLPIWRQFIQLQLIVTVGLTPLLLSAFGTLSLVSPLVNLLAIPWFSAVLAPLVLIGCLLLVIAPTMGTFWLQGVALLLDHTYTVLQTIASWPAATWHLPTSPLLLMALLGVGTLGMIIPWAWRLRVVGAALCVPVFIWRPTPLPSGAFAMTTLDVGQGLAVVIQTRSHVLLYDTGPVFQSGRDTGELVVLPYLYARGITELDMVMASHGDADHVGGLKSVLRELQVGTLLRGPSVPAYSSADVVCQQGQTWEWDNVRFTVLHPDLSHLERSDNNQSCVLRIEGKGGSALLMGDAEKRVEDNLVEQDLIKPTTIVEAGHHGSRSSSTENFVAATQAQYVVFSAGYRNRWVFPKPEVQARWQAAGATSLSTIESGAVTITLRVNGQLKVERYRQQHPHYWQATSPETAPDPPSRD